MTGRRVTRPARELPDPPRYSVHDAAAFWGVDVQTIYRWVRSGKLCHTRGPAGGVHFTLSQLQGIDGGEHPGGGHAQTPAQSP